MWRCVSVEACECGDVQVWRWRCESSVRVWRCASVEMCECGVWRYANVDVEVGKYGPPPF